MKLGAAYRAIDRMFTPISYIFWKYHTTEKILAKLQFFYTFFSGGLPKIRFKNECNIFLKTFHSVYTSADSTGVKNTSFLIFVSACKCKTDGV